MLISFLNKKRPVFTDLFSNNSIYYSNPVIPLLIFAINVTYNPLLYSQHTYKIILGDYYG